MVYEAFPPKVRRLPFSDHEARWLFRTSERTVYRNNRLTLEQRTKFREEILRQWTEGVRYNWLHNLITKDPDQTHCIELLASAQVAAFGPVYEVDLSRVGPRRFLPVTLGLGWDQIEGILR
jgi:hypothetical protein